MHARHEEFTVDTQGDGEVLDVTLQAQKAIDNSGFRDGICTVFVAHSTCGVTTIEFEPGCNADLNRVLEGVAPEADRWEHNERNADTNGHSHVQAAHDRAVRHGAVHQRRALRRHLAEDRLHRLRRPAAVTTAGRPAARRLSSQPSRSRRPDGVAPAARRRARSRSSRTLLLFDRELAADRVVMEGASPAGRDHVEAGEVAARTASIPVAHGPEITRSTSATTSNSCACVANRSFVRTTLAG